MQVKYIYIFCFCILTMIFVNAEERKLKPEVNPGCVRKDICNNSKFIYTRADDGNTTIHYVWDFNGKPTFLLVFTTLDVNMTVDWRTFEKNQSNFVSFTSTPMYMFGIILDQIYEFNDVNDSAVLPITKNDKLVKRFDSSSFNWEITSLLDDIVDGDVLYSVKGSMLHDTNHTLNGSINMNMYAFGKSGHGKTLPHLAHTENSSQIDMMFDQITTSFANSRFAVQFIYFSTDNPQSEFELSKRKTIDDENTPGIFVLDTMTIHAQKNTSSNIDENMFHGFLQWKPVVYTASERNVVNSTQVIQYGARNVNLSNRPEMLQLLSFLNLNKTVLSNFMMKAENISFGFEKDGYYSKTHFLSWSFVVGIGTPPNESFSMVVILVLSIGLGLPLLVIVVGVAYFAYRKVTMHRENIFFVR